MRRRWKLFIVESSWIVSTVANTITIYTLIAIKYRNSMLCNKFWNLNLFSTNPRKLRVCAEKNSHSKTCSTWCFLPTDNRNRQKSLHKNQYSYCTEVFFIAKSISDFLSKLKWKTSAEKTMRKNLIYDIKCKVLYKALGV